MDAATQPDAAPVDAGAPDAGPVEPCAELVYEQLGEVLTVVDGASLWTVSPLAPGEGFTCMRLEFELQTADTLQTILDQGGCPVYLVLAGVFGTEPLASALFKMHRAQTDCPVGPHRLEMDTWVDNHVIQGPWSLGETYQVVLEVGATASTVSLYQGGVQVGPSASATLAGTTVAHTVNSVVKLGLDHPMVNAYWPNYTSVYRDLRIWADRAMP